MIEVTDASGAPLGALRQRLWAKGGAFEVLDAGGAALAALRTGDAANLEDRSGRALATLTPARGAERRLEVDPALDPARRLLLGAALAALDRVIRG
jgi:hypothetical protein